MLPLIPTVVGGWVELEDLKSWISEARVTGGETQVIPHCCA